MHAFAELAKLTLHLHQECINCEISIAGDGLWQIAQIATGRTRHRTVICLQLTGNDSKKRALADAIGTYQAHTFIHVDDE